MAAVPPLSMTFGGAGDERAKAIGMKVVRLRRCAALARQPSLACLTRVGLRGKSWLAEPKLACLSNPDKGGAEGGTRTPTVLLPPAPQAETTRVRAKGTDVTADHVISPTTRRIEGICEINGVPGTYELVVDDGGEPGAVRTLSVSSSVTAKPSMVNWTAATYSFTLASESRRARTGDRGTRAERRQSPCRPVTA